MLDSPSPSNSHPHTSQLIPALGELHEILGHTVSILTLWCFWVLSLALELNLNSTSSKLNRFWSKIRENKVFLVQRSTVWAFTRYLTFQKKDESRGYLARLQTLPEEIECKHFLNSRSDDQQLWYHVEILNNLTHIQQRLSWSCTIVEYIHNT